MNCTHAVIENNDIDVTIITESSGMQNQSCWFSLLISTSCFKFSKDLFTWVKVLPGLKVILYEKLSLLAG